MFCKLFTEIINHSSVSVFSDEGEDSSSFLNTNDMENNSCSNKNFAIKKKDK